MRSDAATTVGPAILRPLTKVPLVLLRSAISMPAAIFVSRVCRFEMFPFASTMSLPETRPIVISSLSKVSTLGSPPFSVSVSLIIDPLCGQA